MHAWSRHIYFIFIGSNYCACDKNCCKLLVMLKIDLRWLFGCSSNDGMWLTLEEELMVILLMCNTPSVADLGFKRRFYKKKKVQFEDQKKGS